MIFHGFKKCLYIYLLIYYKCILLPILLDIFFLLGICISQKQKTNNLSYINYADNFTFNMVTRIKVLTWYSLTFYTILTKYTNL